MMELNKEQAVATTSPTTVKPGGWQLLKQTMARDLPKRDVFNIVLIGVARAFADLNVKDISDNDRDYLVNELTDNIIKRYPSIRLNEIPDAFALGIRGRFGEYYGLSVIAFEKFIEGYLLSEQRTGMVKELSPDEAPSLVPDLTTQFETAKYNTLQALQRKKDKKDLEVIASSVYHFLDRLKLIAYTNAEKYDMLGDAARELIDELKFKLIIARSTERLEIKKDMEALKSAITAHAALNQRLTALVKLRAKKIALDAFLNQIMMEEGDLAGLIEAKKELFFAG